MMKSKKKTPQKITDAPTEEQGGHVYVSASLAT